MMSRCQPINNCQEHQQFWWYFWLWTCVGFVLPCSLNDSVLPHSYYMIVSFRLGWLIHYTLSCSPHLSLTFSCYILHSHLSYIHLTSLQQWVFCYCLSLGCILPLLAFCHLWFQQLDSWRYCLMFLPSIDSLQFQESLDFTNTLIFSTDISICILTTINDSNMLISGERLHFLRRLLCRLHITLISFSFSLFPFVFV